MYDPAIGGQVLFATWCVAGATSTVMHQNTIHGKECMNDSDQNLIAQAKGMKWLTQAH